MDSDHLHRHRHDDLAARPSPATTPATTPAEFMFGLQRSIGNRATEALVQPKREIGAEGGQLDDSTARSIAQARGGGRALDPEVRRSMETGLGADLSRVRVHDDARADELNATIQSSAFTTGKDIFFRDGAYQPSTASGQELLAHELTHVVQQGASDTIQRHFEGELATVASAVKSTTAAVPALLVAAGPDPDGAPTGADVVEVAEAVQQPVQESSSDGSAPPSATPVAAVAAPPTPGVVDAATLRAEVDTYDPSNGDLVEFLQKRVKDIKSIPGMIELKDQRGLITALAEDMAARSETPTTPAQCYANAEQAIIVGGGGGFAAKSNKIFVLEGPETSALIHEMIHVMTADTGVPPLAKQKNNVSEGFTNYFAEAVAKKMGLAIFPAYITATEFATAYAGAFGVTTAWKDYLTDETPIMAKLAGRLVDATAKSAPAWNFHIKKIAALAEPEAKLKYATQQIANTWKSADFSEGDAMGIKLTALL